MLDAKAGLDRLLAHAREVTGAPKGNVQVLDGDVLRICVHHGFERPFLEFFSEVRPHTGSCGSALRSQRNVVVQDVEDSEIFSAKESLEAMLGAGVRSCQSTPILTESGTVVGMLNTHHDRPRSFSRSELARIAALAKQARLLLEHNHISLKGEWDLSRKDELSALLSGITDDGAATIDLSDATYVDSTVLNALARLRLDFTDMPITLIVTSRHIERVLKIAGFDRMFSIVVECLD